MRGIFGLLGTFFAGWLGWWLGARLNLMVAVLLGAIGSGVGLYYGRRLFDDILG